MDAMRDLVLKIKPYTTGYGFLISETGIMVAHPKKNLVGENVRKFVFQTTFDRITLGEPAIEEHLSTITGKPNAYVFVPITPGRTGMAWGIAVAVPVDEITVGAHALRNISILIAVITAANARDSMAELGQAA
ncbi:methyl-accepting chemotaxis sensory transducer [Desulforapulum autotrophicum HRM2]|uniref:Methyl-accepting chemotaxis sensory transducer n=1 Tax=Desulforapulum autotrophicum (strain ATCC 43914 / DSM 3382 / VKM B-1955 / HRM2) TaxID=177437 RepID=C0QCW5_DESAH|nr:methyl-accepting chemotaxis sensory transducer [Desulforapulum autotrophicum]ACN17197.1 methyl-accepting chemotaxis sensory transducer [Desulforapulum autotrophicum HRM2]